MNGYVVLVLIVGPILAGGPPLLACWLCERHANQHGQAHAASARVQVQAAELHAAARRNADHLKELTPR